MSDGIKKLIARVGSVGSGGEISTQDVLFSLSACGSIFASHLLMIKYAGYNSYLDRVLDATESMFFVDEEYISRSELREVAVVAISEFITSEACGVCNGAGCDMCDLTGQDRLTEEEVIGHTTIDIHMFKKKRYFSLYKKILTKLYDLECTGIAGVKNALKC